MVILFDRFNLPNDIMSIIFATDQQIEVARLLIDYMLERGGEITKTEMSLFANLLHEGNLKKLEEENIFFKQAPKFSYNKRQFYDRILTPMKSMGLVDYDLYKKTYKISDSFNRVMVKLGLMWVRYIRKERSVGNTMRSFQM